MVMENLDSIFVRPATAGFAKETPTMDINAGLKTHQQLTTKMDMEDKSALAATKQKF